MAERIVHYYGYVIKVITDDHTGATEVLINDTRRFAVTHNVAHHRWEAHACYPAHCHSPEEVAIRYIQANPLLILFNHDLHMEHESGDGGHDHGGEICEHGNPCDTCPECLGESHEH